MHLTDDCENIKMVISDFDGIFTDCTGVVDINGCVSKKIHFQDVMAIALAIKAGLKVAIITGEAAGAVKYLGEKFPDLAVFQDIKDKLPIVKQLAAEASISPEQILYIGDDINDYSSLLYAGVKVTVPNAHKKIKDIPNIIITDKKGGEGVFREVTDELLNNKIENIIFSGERR